VRIDLHTHSIKSDGSDTPTELLENAAAAGLDVVALTDHDTAAGWSEAAEAAERVGVRLVRGIEFSTTNEGRGQHLLGYNLDPNHAAVRSQVQILPPLPTRQRYNRRSTARKLSLRAVFVSGGGTF
jgi:3',5'-nucleoside bisphosphate phosphatase